MTEVASKLDAEPQNRGFGEKLGRAVRWALGISETSAVNPTNEEGRGQWRGNRLVDENGHTLGVYDSEGSIVPVPDHRSNRNT